MRTLRSANRLQWKFVVMDLLARLMLIIGYSTILFSSYTKFGDHLVLFSWGIKVFIVDCGCRHCFGPMVYPTASTRCIYHAEEAVFVVGTTFTMIAQCWFFVTQGQKTLPWLGVTGSCMVFVAGLLCTVNVYKLQQMNALKEGRIFCRLTPARI